MCDITHFSWGVADRSRNDSVDVYPEGAFHRRFLEKGMYPALNKGRFQRGFWRTCNQSVLRGRLIFFFTI